MELFNTTHPSDIDAPRYPPFGLSVMHCFAFHILVSHPEGSTGKHRRALGSTGKHRGSVNLHFAQISKIPPWENSLRVSNGDETKLLLIET